MPPPVQPAPGRHPPAHPPRRLEGRPLTPPRGSWECCSRKDSEGKEVWFRVSSRPSAGPSVSSSLDPSCGPRTPRVTGVNRLPLSQRTEYPSSSSDHCVPDPSRPAMTRGKGEGRLSRVAVRTYTPDTVVSGTRGPSTVLSSGRVSPGHSS